MVGDFPKRGRQSVITNYPGTSDPGTSDPGIDVRPTHAAGSRGAKLKILIQSINYAPELTGIGKYTGEMAVWLAARGHEVDVVAGLPHYPEWAVFPAYRGRGFRRETLHGTRVMRTPHLVPAPGRVSALGRILMETSFSIAGLYWWAGILCRRRRYDLVIAVCPPLQGAIMPWLYGLVRRVPWVLHIQDFQVDAAVRLGMLRLGPLQRLLYAGENFLVRMATCVSTIAPAMCRRAIQKGADPERTWLVPNWTDTDAMVPGKRDNGLRDELGFDAGHLLVLYAGAMGAKQGLDVVLQAAALVREQPRLQFILVGSGGDRPRLEALARELALTNLRFLPVQPTERMNDLLAIGDIHLVVQRAQAADLVMPSKLANIMAAGRPTVATAAADTDLFDLLRDHDCGVAVVPEDAAALAEALARLADDPARRERMGRNARAHAERYLNRDAILIAFEQQLQGLVDECKKVGNRKVRNKTDRKVNP
ncbi:MAG: WcaI family glycosyltransferase [Porticoccaceae bacterium]